jgi:hypothetical protein
MTPKLTVLTAALAEGEDFDKTFESLRYLALSRELCWIVIKKQDRRETRAIAPGCRMICGPDKGLYYALNIGLGICETIFFQVLGIGDTIIEENEAIAIELVSDVDAIYSFPIEYGVARRLLVPDPEGLRRQMTCPHPGVFCPRDKVLAIDGFSTVYQIASDYELLSRLAKSGIKFYSSNALVVANFKGGGLSDQNPMISALENGLIKKRIWNQPDSLIIHDLGLFLNV